MITKVLYRKSDKVFIGLSAHFTDTNKTGSIEIDNATLQKIYDRWLVIINNDLTLKLTAPVVDNTIPDALNDLKNATTKTQQQEKLIELLLLERGITPK